MKIALAIVYAVVCIALIGVILSQHRKQGGFSGSFGGAGTQQDNTGSWQRMTSASKLTVGLTALFMILAVVIIKLS